jgi:hypothetical protein
VSRVRPLFAAALAALLLSGCDAGSDPLARGADAEAAGHFAEARAHYKEACDKSPKRCPLATRLGERLSVKEAWSAIDAGDYGKARAAIEAAAAASDPAVKAAAEATSHVAEYVHGLAWEEASALPDKEQALPKIEALADLGVPASAKARAWLETNRPGVLLARVKGVCSVGGHVGGTAGGKAGALASCADAGKALALLHPRSPENAEAQAIVQADYARAYPLLKQAENLINQRVELYDRDRLVRICTEKNGESSIDACSAQAVGDRHLPTPSFLDDAWKKKLDEIGDPAFVKALEARYARAESAGEYDPEPWPKPPDGK